MSVRPSVRLSVTWVDQSKTAVVRIMKFSQYGSPIPPVFAFHHYISADISEKVRDNDIVTMDSALDITCVLSNCATIIFGRLFECYDYILLCNFRVSEAFTYNNKKAAGKQRPETRNVLLDLEQIIFVDSILPHLLLPLMYIATDQSPHHVLSTRQLSSVFSARQ